VLRRKKKSKTKNRKKLGKKQTDGEKTLRKKVTYALKKHNITSGVGAEFRGETKAEKKSRGCFGNTSSGGGGPGGGTEGNCGGTCFE